MKKNQMGFFLNEKIINIIKNSLDKFNGRMKMTRANVSHLLWQQFKSPWISTRKHGGWLELEYFSRLKGKNCQPRIIYLMKMPFRNRCEIKAS